MHSTKIPKIQSLFRGYSLRSKRLPTVLYKSREILKNENIIYNSDTDDGRINSFINEKNIIEILQMYLGNRVKVPKIRMWYDILLYDYYYKWIPVNIKITTTTTCDNTGNLAMCVYTYTDAYFDINKSYNNGIMSSILIKKLRNKEYNYGTRDYYFLVINKNDTSDIIINSLRGITNLTPNINNLPFQICWSKNREYICISIYESIKLFIDCIKKPKLSWKETFLQNIRDL